MPFSVSIIEFPASEQLLKQYRKIFHGETEDKEYVTVEDYLSLASLRSTSTTLAKHVLILHILWPRRQSVWHTSPTKDQNKNLCWLTSRTGYDLFDLIASTDLLDETDKQFVYCTGNLLQVAISTSVKDHTCSVFCNLLGLPAIEH